jgi:hypothetical protein
MVRLGKLRWRTEHAYRELKTGLGLDHFEGGIDRQGATPGDQGAGKDQEGAEPRSHATQLD